MSEFFTLGGDLRVRRLGFGAMQITGPGIWGEPTDRDEAIRVLRRAVEAGVTLIDTADAYGPFVSENLIKEALHPYPEDLVIATKGGLVRPGPGVWNSDGRPKHLRQALEGSLQRLGLERIDLYQLHRIDPAVPADDQLGELAALQKEGKIRHIGLSEVSVAELKHARNLVEIVSVQNLYNLTNRQSEDVLDYATANDIGFIPWFPLATGELATRARYWTRKPRATTPHPPSSRLPGCCTSHRSCCRSPAPPRSPTWTRTSPPQPSHSPTRTSPPSPLSRRWTPPGPHTNAVRRLVTAGASADGCDTIGRHEPGTGNDGCRT